MYKSGADMYTKFHVKFHSELVQDPGDHLHRQNVSGDAIYMYAK